MSSLVSRRACAATSSVLLAAVALSGCSLFGGGGSKATDISKLPNIPQGQKQQLVQQMQSASGDQKKQIAAKAVALNNVVGAQLVAEAPVTISQQTFKLDPKGQTVVNKNETICPVARSTGWARPAPWIPLRSMSSSTRAPTRGAISRSMPSRGGAPPTPATPTRPSTPSRASASRDAPRNATGVARSMRLGSLDE